jgi:hypothetical protein
VRKQMIMWTALPNGITGEASNRRLRLSVFVSPRLRGDTDEVKLSQFPDLLDWPSHLQSNRVAFFVQVNNGPRVPASITSPPPASDLWTALFAPDAIVRSHRFDEWTRRPIASYPAAALKQHVKKSYQTVCDKSPHQPATHETIRTAFPFLHSAFSPPPDKPPLVMTEALTPQTIHAQQADNLFRIRANTNLSANITRAVTSARQLARINGPEVFTEVIPNTGVPTSHFAQLAVFHHRPPEGPSVSEPSRLDFHEALSAVGDYPELLRRLGLVIDLELPAGDFPQSTSGRFPARLLQVIPIFSNTLSSPEPSYSPFTAYVLEADRFFLPAPSPPAEGTASEAVVGFLDLQSPGQFEAIQLDLDGAALKAIHMVAGQASTSPTKVTDEATELVGIPALRTSGVWVARSDYARLLHRRFNASQSNNALLESEPPQPATLFAEDLTRGYRVDVFDSRSRDWHSLMRRRGRYSFKSHQSGRLTLEIADEGTVHPALTQPLDDKGGPPESTSQLYIHESLFHWQGWSLAAPRVGKTITSKGPQIVTSTAPPEGFPLEVSFTAEPHSLPHLRFGTHYQFRARTVDLAGNSLSLKDADQLLEFLPLLGRPAPVLPAELNEFTYRRFEPVISPVLVPLEQSSEGESHEHLVIRSNRDQNATVYAEQLTALVASRTRYRGINERHLVPPKTSLWMAETCGRLDDALSVPANESPDEFEERLAQTYRLASREDGRLNEKGHPEAQLRLPYLPDPLSRGAALFGLPGVPAGKTAQVDGNGNLILATSLLPAKASSLGSFTQIPFGSASNWPDLLPFRLQVVEAEASISILGWDPKSRVLTVPLKKAETATIRLSSFINQEDLEILGIWKWMIDLNASQGLPPPDAGTVQTALAGAFWMLTPFREITLVHAVQQPLEEPKFEFLELFPNEMFTTVTFALLLGEIKVHGNSTMKLDLLARWEDPIDLIDEPGPRTVNSHAHVCELPIELPGRKAIESEIDLTKISEPLPQPDQLLRVMLMVRPGVRYVPDKSAVQFGGIRHEFGDTKHHKVRYQAVATTRFREYFPAEITSKVDNLTRSSDEVLIDIPNTARPPAPKVLYVIPTFGWRKTDNAATGVKVHQRIGGGLRVYLDRPWFASGEDERLGVLISDPGTTPTGFLESYLTHWGRDPIWESGSTLNPPAPAHFKNASESASGLTLDEIAGPQPVSVVGHAVNFDEVRKLWFCDIEIDLGQTYFPFVRLALARYQPHSIPTAHLSRVVIADFVQLAPDRTVTISPVQGNPDTFTINVSGLTYQSNAWTTAPLEADNARRLETMTLNTNFTILNDPQPPVRPALVRIEVERRRPGTKDEAGWELTDLQSHVSNAVLAGQPLTPDTPLWTGQVSLPKNRTPGQFRIVVKEFEHLPTDQRDQQEVRIKEDIAGELQKNPGLKEPNPKRPKKIRPINLRFTFLPGADRLVFADTVEI